MAFFLSAFKSSGDNSEAHASAIPAAVESGSEKGDYIDSKDGEGSSVQVVSPGELTFEEGT